MQNSGVSYYEECLTLGQWLSQEDSRALYKFLLVKNKQTYKVNADILLANRQLTKIVAEGEIMYSLSNNIISYQTRPKGTNLFSETIRELRLSKFSSIRLKNIQQFFAQAEVDVIRNFPLPGVNKPAETGYSINTYPFYKLKYYSNGKGNFLGLINKFKTNDTERLKKLSA
mgnify:FL=1